jgi:hypothetical protein
VVVVDDATVGGDFSSAGDATGGVGSRWWGIDAVGAGLTADGWIVVGTSGGDDGGENVTVESRSVATDTEAAGVGAVLADLLHRPGAQRDRHM